MRLRLVTVVGLAAVAAACDSSDAPPPTRQIVVRSAEQDRLHKLSEPNLKIALRRAIYDSGSACQRVESAGYVQEYGNLSMWTASCGDKRSWAVFVGPDGTAQIRRCEEVEQLKLPACVIRKEGRAAG